MLGCLPSPAIGVMQAAEDGHGADRSLASRRWPFGRDSLCRDGRGNGLSDALVGSVVVDVGDVLFWIVRLLTAIPSCNSSPRMRSVLPHLPLATNGAARQ